jgi:hypothetical protein
MQKVTDRRMYSHPNALNQKPYISFVVVGRNDNYGYKFLERFQFFINNLSFLCKKNNLSAELIVIEWNPPKNEKKLWDALEIPSSPLFTCRFIEISKSLHETYKNNGNYPLLEYPGKNIGIRKAKGEFVLITNPDIIFSNEMISFFSKKELERRTLYRASRFDLPIDIPSGLNDDRLLEFCEKKWNTKWDMRFGRHPRGLKKILYIPRMISRFLFPFMFKKYLPYKYHGGMPGDFTLLHKRDWEMLGGYPEIGWSTLLDFYILIFSIVKFGKIKRLPYPIYHQYHDGRIPRYANFNEYLEDSLKMLMGRKLIKNNKKPWGLKGKNLNEIVFR